MYMLKNVLRNLSSGPSTRPYPLEEREPFQAYRGRIHNDVENCIFCSTCARVCPTNAIQVNIKEGRWEYDPFICVYCAGPAWKNAPRTASSRIRPTENRPSLRVLVLKTGTPRRKNEG